jgi:hypothetical protein
MALIKFGGGIVQMSGSIAGNTFARNRFGNYSRSRTTPVNPRSTDQSKVRLILAYLVEYWNEELTPAERAQWATYAAAVSMTNRLGDSIKCTGFNHFIRGNSLRARFGGAPVDAGPAVLTLPPTDPTYAITASVATQLISVTFNNGGDWATEAGAYMMFFQGRPQVATRNFFAGPWRYAGQIDGAAVPPVSPAPCAAVFPLVLGQRIWLAARIIRADARCTIRFQDDCIVAA